MLTLNDIINVSFRKSGFSGYRPEDVDAFIDQVKDSYDALIKKTIDQKEENEKLAAENAQLNRKLEVLASKIEEYRSEEDEIKTALISAQKLGDASIREARHKAEIILKDANMKAERIISGAKQDVVEQANELEKLKKQTADFRAKLLDIYKQHLTMINAIPAQKEEPVPVTKTEIPEEAAPVAEEQPVDYEPENISATEVQAEPQIEQPDLDSTREFSVDAVSFEREQPTAYPSRDLRYDVLKFGEDYSISEDTEDGIR